MVHQLKISLQRYGEPNIELINWIKQNKNNFIFILNTCRIDDLLRLAVEYLQNEHNLVFDFVNENSPERTKMYGGECRKISADYYIDDKSINPNLKEFKDILERIKQYAII